MPRSGLGQDMGLGRLSDADLVFKRKYRWTLEIQGLCVGDIPPFYVKTAARPNLTIDETEINHLHGKTWIPGKGTWETIQVTYYDVQNNAALSTLWSWLASVYNFTDFNGMHQASTRRGYAGTGILKLYDGCGQVMEEWNLYHLWPQAANFGDLDYASSDEVVIELTLRYAFAELISTGDCGPFVNPCCSGCNGAFSAATITTLITIVPPTPPFPSPPFILGGGDGTLGGF